MSSRRGVLFVIVFLAAATMFSAAALAFAFWAAGGRSPVIADHSTLHIEIEGSLDETPPTYFLGGVLQTRREPSLQSIVNNLRKAKADSRVAGVLIFPSGVNSLWGKVQELRDAIDDFKQSGKPIAAFLEYGGQQEYYLATACDRVYLSPGSTLDLVGLASYELFLRGTLDKIGAYPDMHHIGAYKSASNQYTEHTYTPAHREMSESLNADLFMQLVRGIADGRKKSEAEIRQLVDKGPFQAEDAVKAGLIDAAIYEDEIDDQPKSEGFAGRRLTGGEYSRVTLESLGLNRGQRIAVIYAAGVIGLGESGFDTVGGGMVGSKTLNESIRSARGDSGIKAVILRVDSPGGSAIASDLIWRELELTRQAKPLIVSMSDLAASGGYYIAAPAHAIVAQPGSLTGSIGVFGGKIVTGGTYEKVGAHVEGVHTGRYADINSPVRPYSPDERVRIEAQLHAIYDAFVDKVAQGRKSTPERIDAVAQGRVWTGRQAKQVGLVDELGGLPVAVALAKERAKIPASEDVKLVVYPPAKSVYELFAEQFGGGNDLARAASAFTAIDPQALAPLTPFQRWFRRGEPLALMPITWLPSVR